MIRGARRFMGRAVSYAVLATMCGVVSMTGIRLTTSSIDAPIEPSPAMTGVVDTANAAAERLGLVTPVQAGGDCGEGQVWNAREQRCETPVVVIPTPTPRPEMPVVTPTPTAGVVTPTVVPILTPSVTEAPDGIVFLMCSAVTRQDGQAAGMALGTSPHKPGTIFEVEGCGTVIVHPATPTPTP